MTLIWTDHNGNEYEITRHSSDKGFHEDTWSFEKGALSAMMLAKPLRGGTPVCLLVDAYSDDVVVYATHRNGNPAWSTPLASGPKKWPTPDQ